MQALMRPQEKLEDALARVCTSMRPGHNAVDNNDDDDVITLGGGVFPLRDPLMHTRMVTPVRYVDTGADGPLAFDLDAALEMAARTRKWVDPHNGRDSCVQNLQVCAARVCVCVYLVPLP